MKVIHRGRRVRHISLKSLLRDSAERNSAAWLIGMRRSFHHYSAEEGGEESTPSSAFSLLLFQHLNEVSSVIILITMWSGMCLVVNWRLARRSLTCHMSLLWRGEEASVYGVTCVFIHTHTHIFKWGVLRRGLSFHLLWVRLRWSQTAVTKGCLD